MKLKSISIATLIALIASSVTSLNSNLLMLSPIQRVLAQSTETKTSEAVRLLDLCRENINKNQLQAALQSCQQAAVTAQATGDRSTQAKSLSNLGLAYQNTGNLQQALSNYEEALAVAQAIKERALESKVLLNLGEVAYKLGDTTKAKVSFEQALKIYQSIEDQKGEGGALNNLGLAYQLLGDYKRAIYYHSQSLKIARAIGNREGEAKSLGNLGNAYQSLGDYKRAIYYHSQNLEMARAIGNREGEAKSLGNLGNTYQLLGDYKRAIYYHGESLEIARAIGDREWEASSLGNLGVAYRYLGDYKKAIDYHNQSLVIKRAIGNREGEARSLGNLGLAYNSLGDYKKAIDYHNQSLVIKRAIGNREGEARSLGNLGLAYNSLGDYKRAIYFHFQGWAIAKAIGDRQFEAISLNNLGLAHLRSGNPKVAEENLRTAIAVYELIRKDLGRNDAFKISIFEAQARSYRLLQQALVAQKRQPEALLIAERGRAQALIELLATRQQLSSTLLPPSLEQIQQIAEQQNATLVEYSIAWDDLYIWVVKPTGEISFEKVDIKKINLGKAAEDTRVTAANSAEGRGAAHDLLSGLVDKTRSTLSRTYSPTPKIPTLSCRENYCLQQMYKLLIQPIEKQLPTNPDSRVIFIPHESLFLVPFAALQDQNHNFLIEKHTISIAPSIQVLDLIHQQALKLQSSASAAENSLRDALIVGNPMMPKLKPLLWSQKEAEMIAELLKTQALTGKQATLAVVKQRMQKARIIHLATHGLLDDLKDVQIPGKVALAPSNGDDGFLSANDVLNLDLKASLVVLSACDTGWGRITGDGVIGLPRAFITAGVPNIVVSLWQVGDKSTAFLMPEFYRQLQHNHDKARALRQAMLATMKKYPNPSDWAAFVFIGEAD
ncbi:CHAT domain-containing protein [Aetokthonos hydrillicola]|jgi:CHAT domain-containing protein/Tfp pilus assembly protein PilF|uniref:CHAT domain-containing protein n=1 Tax=Aetokthonos hydrillicola TaxID=1550245 RepID=UPI001ABA2280|nr:CHAT domain-containing protein [Aetokthonos hydrillicola]MBO3460780.1 CHAT domain-containing protein [Aetokthonos hydrillicola CCALA 1050]MBW4585377.1 CHAT domain-containing protein [Aetokthonos hydrillicola CCALA 1050]